MVRESWNLISLSLQRHFVMEGHSAAVQVGLVLYLDQILSEETDWLRDELIES